MIHIGRKLVVLVATLGFALSQGCTSTAPSGDPLATVDHVELARYTGTWYEVAKIPNRFQDQCVASTTAHYAMRSDGNFDVTNRCMTRDGKIDEAVGVARVTDKTSNAKLEVSFVSVFGWHLFWGDYWIIGLDDDYQVAVVGTSSREYGWVLSRQPELEADHEAWVRQILTRAGYDPNSFVNSPQQAPERLEVDGGD